MLQNLHHQTEIEQQLGLDQATRSARRLRPWLLGTAITILVGIGIGVWLQRGNSEQIKYQTQMTRTGDLVVTVTATGNLQPTNQVDVGIEVSGTIRSVTVDDNDTVKVGQVLARIDTTKLEAQVLQSQAALAAARARVLQAKATVEETRNQYARLQRMRELTRNETPSQQDLDAAKATLDRAAADQSAAEAAVAQTSAQLNAYRTDLSKAAVRSPINGIVLKRNVEPGQTVAATLQAPILFTLAEDLTQMELHVDVDEADVGQVHVGQPAIFTVAAYPNQSFPAHITSVRYGSTTASGVVTYEAVLKVVNTGLTLRPGMTATAVITVNKIDHATLIPNAALRFAPPEKQARAANDGGIVSKLFPRMPRLAATSTSDSHNGAAQQVWALRNGRLAAIPVTIAATDGTSSAVASGEVTPGMPLVIDIDTAQE